MGPRQRLAARRRRPTRDVGRPIRDRGAAARETRPARQPPPRTAPLMGRPYHISPIVQGVLSTMAGLYETDGWHSEDYLSPAEVDLATALFDAGVRGFRQQHPIGRYTVDF